MSLELSNSDPKVTVFTSFDSKRIEIQSFIGGEHVIDIPMTDFCALVFYGLTNTDLTTHDPRYLLLERIKNLGLAEGFNKGAKRLA